ncbi:helix-turn-helix domain-containing protein [Nocardioides sp.]|uniref:helix-turn-helix domain-containing protein n=1 Tax=Nocardioides sp. TaxID=35761 RepID=UPI0039E3D191
MARSKGTATTTDGARWHKVTVSGSSAVNGRGAEAGSLDSPLADALRLSGGGTADRIAYVPKDGYTVIVVSDGVVEHDANAEAALRLIGSTSDGLLLPLTEAVESEAGAAAAAGDPFDEFWGPAPTRTQSLLDRVGGLAATQRLRNEVLSVSLTRSEAAEALGISPQAVSERIESRSLLALKSGREWRMPAWQFDLDSPTGVIERLDELVDAFPAGVVSLSDWMTSPSQDLDGITPEQAMKRGGSERVLAVVRSLTAAAW